MAEYRAIEGEAGEEDILIGKSVKTLTIPAALSAFAVRGRAKIQVRTASIIYSLNNVTPLEQVLKTGSTLEVGDILTVEGSELSDLKMVRATPTDAAVHIRYERRIS